MDEHAWIMIVMRMRLSWDLLSHSVRARQVLRHLEQLELRWSGL